MENKLVRSRSERMLAGVCGGLAEYLKVDVTVVRLVAVLLAFADGIGIIAYIVLAIVMPNEGSRSTETAEAVRENVAEFKGRAQEIGSEIQDTLKERGTRSAPGRARAKRLNTVALILILLGVIFLMSNFNLFWWFPWFSWKYLWPVALIMVGVIIIVSARRKP